MRILIAGAGYVGAAAGEELARRGHEVFGLRRDPSSLPPALVPVAADLGRPETLERIPGGIEAAVYAASPHGSDEASYADCYVTFARALLDVLARRGDPVRRVVLTSSTSVFDARDGEDVDESSPAEPAEGAGARIREGERLVLAGPFPATVVRLAGIYGPGREGLVGRVRSGQARTPRAPRYTNRIHRDDCAGVIAHVLSHASPAPLYVGVDLEPADLGEVQRFVAERLGLPAPPLEDEATPEGRRGSGHKRCRPTRLVASGYAHQVPTFREGYAPLVPARR